jgi:predicted AAA+ superfamily ATPase
VLEGSVSAKATNIVIYATSNRRHMVKELFSDREGDDIHRNETIQELCSLSHRFGLTVGFFKPDKKAYLSIVHALKDDYGIQMDDALLDLEAERFASAGRSPRIARQFIDALRRNVKTSR